MQKVVLDSDIIIDSLRRADKTLRHLLEQSDDGKLQLFLPGVVVTELMAGQETRQTQKIELLEKLFTKMQLIMADYNLAKEAGFLLRDYRHLKMGDSLVAATALTLDAKLATRNKKDFGEIRGLKLFKL